MSSKKTRTFLSILLGVFVVVILIVLEISNLQVLTPAWQFVDEKIYEIKRLSGVKEKKQYISVFNSYKPASDIATFSAPENIFIDPTFPTPVKEVIREQLLAIQKIIPIGKLGKIYFYTEVPEVFADYPLIFADSGVVYIPVGNQGTNVNETEYYVQRAVITIFLQRTLSEKEKDRYVVQRGIKVPKYLNKHWDYLVDPITLRQEDLLFSPIEDFVNVYIRAFLNKNLVSYNQSQIGTDPRFKLLMKAQAAKLLQVDENKLKQFGLTPATAITLTNRVKHKIFLSTTCTTKEEPIIKETYFVLYCKENDLQMVVAKNKSGLKDLYTFDLGVSSETIDIKHGGKAYFFTEIIPQGQFDQIYAHTFNYIVYEMPNTKEVIMVEYKKKSETGKQEAISALEDIQELVL